MKIESLVKSPSFIYDRLYGHLGFEAGELELFQTKELARLRHVSLSAIPTWTIPTSICATKFEHSVGVAHLAKIVGQRKEFKEIALDLYFAALAHDMGTPPFSHASEYFQIKLLKKNHEQFAEDVINGSEFAKVVTKNGGKIERVIDLVLGRDKPMSDLVNGSIDIDNLDNSLRFGLSMGILQKASYSPEKLAKAYAFENNQLVLLNGYRKEIAGWEATRKLVYDFVYGESNLSSETVLFRALDFAVREGDLHPGYFMMTDEEAFRYLLTDCNTRTRKLMDRINRWMFYPRVYNLKTTELNDDLEQMFLDSDQRGKIADEISYSLGIEPEDVCVYLGKSKAFKQIHLPIVGTGQFREVHKPSNRLTYMAQVYVHPKHEARLNEVRKIMDQRLRV